MTVIAGFAAQNVAGWLARFETVVMAGDTIAQDL